MTEITVDLKVLREHLVALGEKVEGGLTAARMGGGHSNLTYDVRDEGAGRWVARRPPLGTLLASAHDVVRESRILSALSSTDVLVPKVLGVLSDPWLCDAPVVVMEHIEGLVVDRIELAEAMTPAARAGVGPSMTDALACLHAVDIDEIGLTTLSSHRPYAERQLARWSRQWEATLTVPNSAMRQLGAMLRLITPSPGELSLVHGDFHLRNVVLDGGTGAVRAVLDWELSTLGDPVADLGTLLAYWAQDGDDLDAALFAGTARPGFATRSQLVDSYVSSSGRGVEDLRFWHALALWKVAVIAEGVVRRGKENPGNVAEGAPTRATIDRLVAEASEIVAAPSYP